MKMLPRFYDKDAFHDAICIVYNLAYLGKIDALTISVEMIRTYYNRCVTNKMFAAFACMPVEDSTLEWIIDKEHQEEEEEPESKDWYGMLEYAKGKMMARHRRLINYYLKGVSVKNIALCEGMNTSAVSKELASCKNLIIKNIPVWD